GRAEESALLVFGKPAVGEDIASTAIKMDWPQLKELGRELGLADLRSTDTALEACHVLDQYERYAVCQHFFPWPRTLMHTPGPFRLDELGCNYLNQSLGKPRGFRGEYLYQLPSKIILEVRSNSGAPVSAQIDAFQLQSEGEAAGYICGAGRDPLYSATTGADGRLELPNLEAPALHTPGGYKLGPNPFGKIATNGSNGLLLFRIRHTHESIVREEFHFLRLYDCNLAYIRGDHDSHVHVINTRFPDPDAPLAPPFTLVVMDDRSAAKPPLKLRWRTTTSLLKLDEYRVYRRVGLGGDSETPWTLASIVRKTDKRWILDADVPYFETPPPGFQYSLDTFFAVVAVDKHGRESGLAGQTFLTAGKDGVKMAIDVDNAFMTLRGRGIVPMLHWDGNIGTQPFMVNTSSVKHYHPAFAGIAVTPEHRVLISDPANHVLGVYDLSGNLETLMPHRPFWPGFASDKPGEFNDPQDVAVDKQGRIIVADRGNDRVQVLDSQGKFLGTLDEQTRLVAPSAVACSNNHLCVTDRSGSRVRIYKIDGEKPVFEREITGLVNADRAIVNPAGKVYVTAQDPQSLKQAVLVFGLKDDVLKLESARFEGEMGKLFDPRGGYLYDYLQDNFLYVLNAFPFDLRRIKME
ncbi:MAG TPA: NHL repeat-containing protein, partial [Phycisphaerae bacterium]|nr:NHL repeat-containing protein [Phycisphaerae bacterium]